MARSSTSFQPGQSGNPDGRRKGTANKPSMAQREIFDEAISHDDRVMIVKSVFQRAMLSDNKEAAPYCKMIFDFVFSRPKIGHVVSVMEIDEVMSPEVCSGVWEAIQLEARERERNASKAKDQPRLELVDAQVVATTNKGSGRRNGPTRKG